MGKAQYMEQLYNTVTMNLNHFKRTAMISFTAYLSQNWYCIYAY